MKRISLFAALILISACTVRTPDSTRRPTLEDQAKNPLMAEIIGDQMIEFVAAMQIRANDKGEPITDPATLRVIDDTLIKGRRLQDRSHAQQEEGKSGSWYGVNDALTLGKVMLAKENLYFGYDFKAEPAPDLFVYLTTHVAPHTEEELFEGQTINLGPLQNIVGPQVYDVSALSKDDFSNYRTVALYSTSLKMVTGLAQIRLSIR